jgi:hypothetical protein
MAELRLLTNLCNTVARSACPAARRDSGGNLRQVQAHRFGVAPRQHQTSE